MQSTWTRIARFLRSEDGPTSVEYAVVLALLSAVAFIGVRLFATSTSNSFQNSANSIAS
jgi:pilus assembly protein Flp/PilA